jgi:phosphatidylglycerophosphatase A
MVHAIVLVLLVAIAWWTISLVLTDDKDPKWVTIDEATGVALATIGLGLAAAIVAWGAFRLADIFKVLFPGVVAAERLPGATGVIADDLVAGLYGLAAGWLFQSMT